MLDNLPRKKFHILNSHNFIPWLG